jgi:hypothetical protein
MFEFLSGLRPIFRYLYSGVEISSLVASDLSKICIPVIELNSTPYGPFSSCTTFVFGLVGVGLVQASHWLALRRDLQFLTP